MIGVTQLSSPVPSVKRSASELFVYIKKELYDHHGIDPRSVSQGTTFASLELDSDDIYALVNDVERQYKVDVEDSLIPRLETPFELARHASSLDPKKPRH